MCLLPAFALRAGEVPVKVPAAGRRLATLLALYPGPLTAQQAASMLWPRLSERQAASSLRTARWRVRAASPSLLVDDPSGLRLHPDVTVDAWELEALALDMTERPADVIDTDPRRFAAELLPDSRDDWVLAQHAHLRELCLRAVEAQARHYLASSDYGSASNAIYVAITMEPERESATRTLMEIDLAEGNQIDAVRAYLRLEQRLARDGTAPSNALRALVAPLLDQLAPGAAERLLRWS